MLLLLLLTVSAKSQIVEVLAKGDTLQKPSYQQFIYLSDSTAVSDAVFVSRIKATGSLRNVTHLYYFIKNKAQEKGANGFKFESFEKINDTTSELTLSVYFCNDTLFEANFAHIPKNKIYIFGKENLLEQETQSYKIQSKKYDIGNGRFRVFDIKEGEEYKINKGGFTGMTYWIKRKPEGYSSFLSFSGLGLNGANYMVGGGVGVSFNTGKIDHVDPNLALVLLRIYNEQK